MVTPKDPTHLDSTGLNWFWNVQNPTTGRKTDQISRSPVESRRKSGHTKFLVWPLLRRDPIRLNKTVLLSRVFWCDHVYDATQQNSFVESRLLVWPLLRRDSTKQFGWDESRLSVGPGLKCRVENLVKDVIEPQSVSTCRGRSIVQIFDKFSTEQTSGIFKTTESTRLQSSFQPSILVEYI